MRVCHSVFFVAALCCTFTFAQQVNKTKVIEAVIKTEEWAGWGGGEPLPEGLKAEQTPEKFTRIAPSGDGVQTFSGKVVGLKPDQRAEVGVVALKGTHWINTGNYEWFPLDSSRSFSITSTKNPEARKTLAIRAGNGQWSYLRAEFEPAEGANDIELRVKPAQKVVITMEDAAGNGIGSFRGEIFNAYVMSDDQGNELRPQRFGNPTSKDGAMVLELPAEPFGVLLAAEGVAPYYEIIDPREANHFHFRMLTAARIKGVITRDGKPAANESFFMVNNAAPLSATRRKTDARGRFDVPGRVPGIQSVMVGDYENDVEVKPGETAELKIDLTGPGAVTQ